MKTNKVRLQPLISPGIPTQRVFSAQGRKFLYKGEREKQESTEICSNEVAAEKWFRSCIWQEGVIVGICEVLLMRE